MRRLRLADGGNGDAVSETPFRDSTGTNRGELTDRLDQVRMPGELLQIQVLVC